MYSFRWFYLSQWGLWAFYYFGCRRGSFRCMAMRLNSTHTNKYGSYRSALLLDYYVTYYSRILLAVVFCAYYYFLCVAKHAKQKIVSAVSRSRRQIKKKQHNIYIHTYALSYACTLLLCAKTRLYLLFIQPLVCYTEFG